MNVSHSPGESEENETEQEGEENDEGEGLGDRNEEQAAEDNMEPFGGGGGGGVGDSEGSGEDTAVENDCEEIEMDNESEADVEDDDDDDHDDDPLYNGARSTFGQSMLAILTFILSHKLTGICVNDLLSLIELHCAANNLCVKTIYKFKQYFKMIGKNFITCHYYCSVCQLAVAGKY
ncbi:major centromere autoantigen B-like [Frankliniella occidentalis]|uniref:Major centromere autoantigen B-like n=1 Tax=Frankliniella occidentalis TaxID=133901 RepID=A0A6J1TGM0_FRAOC|nr:major centromere autoantigen B-like [Frankliniella occidentalis]